MENELERLRFRVATLEQKMLDENAREYFFKLPKYWLDDIERGVCPPAAVPYVLKMVQQKLGAAQKALDDYGPEVRIVGD
jgi:hypothetical protein